LDKGTTWRNVDELTMEDKPKGKVFSWTLWKASIDAKDFVDSQAVVQVRAVDSKGKVQDGDIKKLYNLRGILNNAPHQVQFTII
jgi:Mo-co oxidoreductase dimerisation domain